MIYVKMPEGKEFLYFTDFIFGRCKATLKYPIIMLTEFEKPWFI